MSVNCVKVEFVVFTLFDAHKAWSMTCRPASFVRGTFLISVPSMQGPRKLPQCTGSPRIYLMETLREGEEIVRKH